MPSYEISYEQIMEFFGVSPDYSCTHLTGGGKKKFVSAFDKDHRCRICGQKCSEDTTRFFEKRVECLNKALESGKLKKSDSLMEIARNRLRGVFDGTESSHIKEREEKKKKIDWIKEFSRKMEGVKSVEEYAERFSKKQFSLHILQNNPDF